MNSLRTTHKYAYNSIMRIDAYEFGDVSVDGQHYCNDVIVTPDKVIDDWWRREGHSLHMEDLAAALEAHPEFMVIGTGYYGKMKVPTETRKQLERKGITVVTADTKQAVNEFNQLQQNCARVVAALHLTC